jgi:sugar phosphate isomerase/epimerase
MKFAFSNLGAPAWSIPKVAQEARRMGYDGVELRLLDGEVIDPVVDRAALHEAARVCRGQDVEICALDTSCRFNLADAAERARQVQVLRHWIAAAHELHVPVLRVFGGDSDDPAVSDADGNAWVAEALEQVVPEAEQANVTVALETHDAFSSARRVAEVLRAVDAPQIGAVWDSQAPCTVGESVETVVECLARRLVHVHAKDARRVSPDSPQWELVLVGEGTVPVREQLHALLQLDYRGYVSVEWEKKWHPGLAEPEVALPQHIQWLRNAVASGL